MKKAALPVGEGIGYYMSRCSLICTCHHGEGDRPSLGNGIAVHKAYTGRQEQNPVATGSPSLPFSVSSVVCTRYPPVPPPFSSGPWITYDLGFHIALGCITRRLASPRPSTYASSAGMLSPFHPFLTTYILAFLGVSAHVRRRRATRHMEPIAGYPIGKVLYHLLNMIGNPISKRDET